LVILSHSVSDFGLVI